MDLDALKIFIETARRGSFAAAAQSRDVDPSSISRAIAALEAELGARLFQRSTRKLALTEAGEGLLTRIEPLIAELEDACHDAGAQNSGLKGWLRVTTSFAFGLRCVAPALPELRAIHPELRIDLQLTDEMMDLISERIDVALRLGVAPQGEFIASRLMRMRYHVVASPAYLARCGAPARPRDLSSHDCVRLSLPAFRSAWQFAARGSDELEEVPVGGAIVVSNPLAAHQCTLDGTGPALLADWLVAGDLHARRLIDLFPDHRVTATDFETGVWAIYPSRAFLPLKTRAFIDFMRGQLDRRSQSLRSIAG